MAFSRRLVLRRRATTVRLACCSRWVRGKSRTNEVDVVPNELTHPATQALCQLADDPQAATRLDPSESRSVIGHTTVHPGTGTHQFDFDFAVAAVEAGMADRVRHQLVDGQRQAPAPLRFQRQRVDRQQKVDVHAVQLAPAHGQAKLAKLFACVDEARRFPESSECCGPRHAGEASRRHWSALPWRRRCPSRLPCRRQD